MHAIVIGDGAMPHDMSLAWKRTNDYIGHTPLFDVFCKYHKEDEMFMRYSQLVPKHLEFSRLAGQKNQVEYKCMKCGWVARFFIDEDEEYLDKVKGWRIQRGLSEHQWEEDEEKKKQLQTLGYLGGREDLDEKTNATK